MTNYPGWSQPVVGFKLKCLGFQCGQSAGCSAHSVHYVCLANGSESGTWDIHKEWL